MVIYKGQGGLFLRGQRGLMTVLLLSGSSLLSRRDRRKVWGGERGTRTLSDVRGLAQISFGYKEADYSPRTLRY